jgi:DNA-directed RNA polymerase subunit RPC12/RpoP
MQQPKKDKSEFEKIPVVACKYCKSLNIQEDDNGNDLCMRCSAINEIEHYSTIEEYLKITNNDQQK